MSRCPHGERSQTRVCSGRESLGEGAKEWSAFLAFFSRVVALVEKA